jgi:hypothetical protein
MVVCRFSNGDRSGHHHLRERGGPEPGTEDLQSQCGEHCPTGLQRECQRPSRREYRPPARSGLRRPRWPAGAPGAAGGSMPGGSEINRLQLPLMHSRRRGRPRLPYRPTVLSRVRTRPFNMPGGTCYTGTSSARRPRPSVRPALTTSSGPPATASRTADTPPAIRTGSSVHRTTLRGVNPAAGCWSWLSTVTSSEWFVSGAFPRDYAIIHLQSSGTVKNADVATVTGSLGFAWNWGRDQAWFHLGYPAASPFTSGKIILTATEHRYDDSAQGSPRPTPGAATRPPARVAAR